MSNGNPRRVRRGNVAVIVAISSVFLLSFAALTVDLGYARLVQQQLENASEAAARAGSLQLDGTAEGLAAARLAAATMAAENDAAGAPVVLDDADIVLGVWDDDAGTFTASTDPLVVNTVEVRAHNDALALFIAPAAFARASVAVAGRTRAMARSGGASAVDCFLPLAIPSCIVDREGLDGLQDLTLRLNPAGVDNVGWARPNGHPNASWTRDQLENCEADGEVVVGTPIGLNNGVISSAISELDAQIEGSDTRWSTTKWGALPARPSKSKITPARYGNTFEGPLMVFDGGPSYCTGGGGSFTGSEPLVSFVWAAVYDIEGNGANTNLSVRIDTSENYALGTKAGGADQGVVARLPPRMVRNE